MAKAKKIPAKWYIKDGRVSGYIDFLKHKLIEYDRRYQSGNIYALSHYMGAVQRVREAMASDLDSQGHAALKRLRTVVGRELLEDFSPAKATIREIDKALAKQESSKNPKKSKVSMRSIMAKVTR